MPTNQSLFEFNPSPLRWTGTLTLYAVKLNDEKHMKYFLCVTVMLTLTIGPICGAWAEAGTVQWVTDGDSIRALIDGRSFRIRLICVDAPETKVNEKALKDSKRLKQSISQIVDAGLQSKKYLQSLLKSGSKIKIVPGEERFDTHGRLLGYVYTADGTFINKKMIETGYAGVLCYAPNDSKAQEFIETMHSAKSSQRGLWADANMNLAERWKR